MSETSPSPGLQYRKLRIAWSVVWVLFILFLVVAWVASYHAILAADAQLAALKHQLARQQSELAKFSGIARGESTAEIGFQERMIVKTQQELAQYQAQLKVQQQPQVRRVTMYHSILLLWAATLATAPWLRWRFSLRTLLIGMTVVAAILGAIVWAVK